MVNLELRKYIRKILKEVVSTDFNNDGWGGIDSQTKEDLMGYWHSESGPLHRGPQPAEDVVKHFYFHTVSSEGGEGDSGESSEEENIEESDENSEKKLNFVKNKKIKK
jgi:hypothetical protein